MAEPGEPIFIGFLPKTILPRPEGFKAEIAEICSVSDCLADVPDGGLEEIDEYWDRHFLSTEQAARAAVDTQEKIGTEPGIRYGIYAYCVFPIWFRSDKTFRGIHKTLQLPDLSVMPDLADYQMIGYDVVQIEDDLIGCSPLSCNGMAGRIPVNQYCLIDDLTCAAETASLFAQGGVEPGDYVIFEVWRKK